MLAAPGLHGRDEGFLSQYKINIFPISTCTTLPLAFCFVPRLSPKSQIYEDSLKSNKPNSWVNGFFRGKKVVCQLS